MDNNLLQNISEYTDIKTCLQIVCLNKWTANNIKIKYIIYNIILNKRINDFVLKQKSLPDNL